MSVLPAFSRRLLDKRCLLLEREHQISVPLRLRSQRSKFVLLLLLSFFCPFGELGLRPFTGHRGRRVNAFTGGQAFS